MANTRFVAWGELLWDLFPDRSRLGGASANAAYHATCLGARATLVSRIGNDGLGARALDELGRVGVDTQAIQLDARAPTGTVEVTLIAGEPHYEIASGVAWDQLSWTEALTPTFAEADVVSFGTLAQRGPRGFDALKQALSRVQQDAIRFCDLNLREPFVSYELVAQALSLATVVKLNEAELARLEQLFGQSDLISWLLNERGIELVALTRGARGAVLVTAHERYEHPGVALSSSNGDAVGAGDAFGAALTLNLAQGLTLPECLAHANRYAAHVASHAGGMPAPPPWVPGRALSVRGQHAEAR